MHKATAGTRTSPIQDTWLSNPFALLS